MKYSFNIGGVGISNLLNADTLGNRSILVMTKSDNKAVDVYKYLVRKMLREGAYGVGSTAQLDTSTILEDLRELFFNSAVESQHGLKSRFDVALFKFRARKSARRLSSILKAYDTAVESAIKRPQASPIGIPHELTSRFNRNVISEPSWDETEFKKSMKEKEGVVELRRLVENFRKGLTCAGDPELQNIKIVLTLGGKETSLNARVFLSKKEGPELGSLKESISQKRLTCEAMDDLNEWKKSYLAIVFRETFGDCSAKLILRTILAKDVPVQRESKPLGSSKLSQNS